MYNVSLRTEPLNQCQQLPARYKQFIHQTSNETNIPQQTIDGSKITAKQQLTNQCNFHVLMTNRIMTKLTNSNHDRRHKYHHLTTTLFSRV